MQKHENTVKTVIIGLMVGVLILMSMTPLGYLNIGPLSITLNMIPVAIGAVSAGKKGSTILGCVFGLTSLLSCIGLIIPPQPFGVMLFGINKFYTIILNLGTRLLTGFLLGCIADFLKYKITKKPLLYSLIGFLSAFFNTIFYMTTLMVLFGNTPQIMEIRNTVPGGSNALLFVVAFVGINCIAELISSTLVTSLISTALHKAKFI